MKKVLLIILSFFASYLTTAQEIMYEDQERDEIAVIDHVERFLTAAGNYDIEAMPSMFCDKANIGGASLRNGKWISFTMTASEFFDLLRSQKDPNKYTEPVTKYTVHMERGMLAFVKADAILIRDGQPRSNNFDYFTLIKENGNWKILNGSYVSVPLGQ